MSSGGERRSHRSSLQATQLHIRRHARTLALALAYTYLRCWIGGLSERSRPPHRKSYGLSSGGGQKKITSSEPRHDPQLHARRGRRTHSLIFVYTDLRCWVGAFLERSRPTHKKPFMPSGGGEKQITSFEQRGTLCTLTPARCTHSLTLACSNLRFRMDVLRRVVTSYPQKAIGLVLRWWRGQVLEARAHPCWQRTWCIGARVLCPMSFAFG